MTQKTAIIVLGMHRSGTSSVAGALSRLGAEAPRTQMPVADDNPRGFFESRLIGELNDRILEAGGSWWSDWRKFEPGLIDAVKRADFKAEIVSTILHEFANASTIVLKDPRLCRLWSIWDGVMEGMGYRVVHVLPLRSPLEVAGSLKTRNEMPIAQGLALWLRHVLDAERVTRHAERRLIRWSSFMQDWRSAADSIGEMLEAGSLNFGRSAEIDAYLSRDLQHEVVPDASLSSAAETHAWAIEAYACLTAVADGDGPKAALNRLDQLRDRFDTASDLFGRATASAVDLARRLPDAQAETADPDTETEETSDLRLRLASAELALDGHARSLEGLKTILAQERASKSNLVEDHAQAIHKLEVAATAERQRRQLVEERLKLSMKTLVDREIRLAATSSLDLAPAPLSDHPR